MPQSDGAPAGASRPMVGKILTQEEKNNLLVFHIEQIAAQQVKVEAAKVPVTEAKAELTDEQERLTALFNSAKSDLGRGYSREFLQGLIKDRAAKVRDLVAIEQLRAHSKMVLGQPVFNQQPELFPGKETPDATKDDLAWEAECYARGRAGALDPLAGVPAHLLQSAQTAFDAGQAETQRLYLAGQKIAQDRAQPSTEAAVDLNVGAKAEDKDLDPETIDAQARKLKANGFTEGAKASKAKSSGPKLAVSNNKPRPRPNGAGPIPPAAA